MEDAPWHTAADQALFIAVTIDAPEGDSLPRSWRVFCVGRDAPGMGILLVMQNQRRVLCDSTDV
jgi:hypothetical protein